MKAINLIPAESRRTAVSPSLGRLGPVHAVLGLLVVGLAFVTVYVLAANNASSRRAELASLKQQVAQVQTEVTRLQRYAQFEQLAQARAATVRQIAATRFDWHGALSDLSRVVPADVSLQSLVATSSSTTSGTGSSASAGGDIRGAINAPAFQLKGCTHNQDQVAQLMARLRLINGVTRVTLQDSVAQASGTTGATVPQPAGSSGAISAAGDSSGGGCPAKGPSFDMVVFFQPVPGAAGNGATR